MLVSYGERLALCYEVLMSVSAGDDKKRTVNMSHRYAPIGTLTGEASSHFGKVCREASTPHVQFLNLSFVLEEASAFLLKYSQ